MKNMDSLIKAIDDLIDLNKGDIDEFIKKVF